MHCGQTVHPRPISYYGTLIGNSTTGIQWYNFRPPGVTPNRGMGPPWGTFCQITLTSCYYYYYYYYYNMQFQWRKANFDHTQNWNPKTNMEQTVSNSTENTALARDNNKTWCTNNKISHVISRQKHYIIRNYAVMRLQLKAHTYRRSYLVLTKLDYGSATLVGLPAV